VRILLINSYHYRKGGADAVYFNTARLLEKYGHEVFFFSTKHPDNEYDVSTDYFARGRDYRKLPTGKKIFAFPVFIYNKEAHKKLLKFVDEIKPDLVNIHLFMGGLSSSILTGLKKKGIPVIHTVHDYRLICPAYLFINGKNEVCEKCKDGIYLHCILNRCSGNGFFQSAVLAIDAYFRKFIVKPVHYIDRFIFVSEFIQRKHIEFNPEFAPKAVKLYNFNPAIDSIVPSINKGDYFLFFGRISREKGILTLIEAALKAKVTLKVVGTGPMFDQLKAKHHENVDFLGYKSGDELWTLVRDASFIIVPSEWYENNPLTIIEAYSFGKPVIGARIGGIPEIVEENVTGYLFEPGNKSELGKQMQFANNLSDVEYSEMSKNARSFAEKYFSPDEHYNSLITIYKDVINSN
jgi:glycosyltransferase involved in cell wall biosynthesis